MKTSLETPLPVVSPPRSIMCRLTRACFSLPSTSNASRAERNMRSSFGVITTSPGFRMRQQRRTLRAVTERLGSRHAALHEHLVDHEAMHLGIAGDHALLNIQALALVGLLDGGDAGVAVAAASGYGRGRCTGSELAGGRRIEVSGKSVAVRVSGHGGAC